MIAYATQPILAFKTGDLISGSLPDTFAVLLDDDNVLSVQPDGSYQTRPRATLGAWESARKVGDKLVYLSDGQVHVVPIIEGL